MYEQMAGMGDGAGMGRRDFKQICTQFFFRASGGIARARARGSARVRSWMIGRSWTQLDAVGRNWTQLDAVGRARAPAGARASACAHARARRGATIRLISFLPQVAQDHFCNLFMET